MVQQIQPSCSECKNCDQVSVKVCSRAECQYLCYHMYSCDQQCYDYSNGHICKHIHRAHSLWLQSNDIDDDSFFCAEDNGESHVESDSPLEIAESTNDTCIGK